LSASWTNAAAASEPGYGNIIMEMVKAYNFNIFEKPYYDCSDI
jgi:hypothetical protein